MCLKSGNRKRIWCLRFGNRKRKVSSKVVTGKELCVSEVVTGKELCVSDLVTQKESCSQCSAALNMPSPAGRNLWLPGQASHVSGQTWLLFPFPVTNSETHNLNYFLIIYICWNISLYSVQNSLITITV